MSGTDTSCGGRGGRIDRWTLLSDAGNNCTAEGVNVDGSVARQQTLDLRDARLLGGWLVGLQNLCFQLRDREVGTSCVPLELHPELPDLIRC